MLYTKEIENYEISKKLNSIKGEYAALAKCIDIIYTRQLFSQDFYMNPEYAPEAIHSLHTLLFKNATTIEDVCNNGLAHIIVTTVNKAYAKMLLSALHHIPKYNYEYSNYRRTFRAKQIDKYFYQIGQIIKAMYCKWDTYDLATYLTMSSEERKSVLNPMGNSIELLLAVAIDSGDADIKDILKRMLIVKQNISNIERTHIAGIIKSGDVELQSLLLRLLLTTKRQEKVKQTIFELADKGTIPFFFMMIKTILEHDLTRFPPYLRAVSTWMGLGYEYENKQNVDTLLALVYTYYQQEPLRKKALHSIDSLQMYGALYVESLYGIENIYAYAEAYINKEKHLKLVGLSLLRQSGFSYLNTTFVLPYLEENDLDVMTHLFVLLQFVQTYYYGNRKEVYIENCRNNIFLKNKLVRAYLFDRFTTIYQQLPEKEYKVIGTPFPWSYCCITKNEIFRKMMIIEGYCHNEKQMETLLTITSQTDHFVQQIFIDTLLEPTRSQRERSFLFDCLKSKSMPVRVKAMTVIKTLQLSDIEKEQIQDVLSLKTSELRQLALEILKASHTPKQHAYTLITSKQERKRLGALDILLTLKRSKKVSPREIKDILQMAPKTTEQEQIYIDQILNNTDIDYCSENGFGLYDPTYRPTFNPPQPNTYTLKAFAKEDAKTIQVMLDSLITRIKAHKDESITIVKYDDSLQQQIFDTLSTLPLKAEVRLEKGRNGTYALDDYVYMEEWIDWLVQEKIRPITIVKLQYVRYVVNENVDYAGWANAWFCEHLEYEEIHKIEQYLKHTTYANLAIDIINKLLYTFDKREVFEISYGIVVDFINKIDDEYWYTPMKDIGKEDNYPNYIIETKELTFFTDRIISTQDNDDFLKGIALHFLISEKTKVYFMNIDVEHIARAYQLGAVNRDALYHCFFTKKGTDIISFYTSIVVDTYPILKEVSKTVAQRVIEIEIKRGDSPTEVSHMASAITYHEGIESFISIVLALGKEPLHRGYIYHSNTEKKAVLSSLLQACHPAKEDDVSTLKTLIQGRITNIRLLEVAMYAPSWIPIIQEYLGWQGLKSAIWYFHAHTAESAYVTLETEVSRFSSIPMQSFQDGAFDIDWFLSVYKALGKEKFDTLYTCAKCISSSGTHRRLLLFTEVVLGKVKESELLKECITKRNKMALLAYSLLPLGKQPLIKAVERYEYVQLFLKQSKVFGAQRRDSEKKVCTIALDNVARNLGYQDGIRFIWKMELLKIEEIMQYFTFTEIEDMCVKLDIDVQGNVSLHIFKKEKISKTQAKRLKISENTIVTKQLKCIPKKHKKHPYIITLRTVKKELQEQYHRSKVSLEKAMVTQEIFTFNEIKELLLHPIIKPLLTTLVYKHVEQIGFLTEMGLQDVTGVITPLQEDDVVTIAHCYDMKQLQVWDDLQHYAYNHKLVQPFLQIFRQL